MENKANLLAVPITLAFVALGTIILAILKFGWVYFLIGALVGLMNHGLMLKQSYRITRYAELDPEGKTLNPKKTALIWYLMRVLVFVAVFVACGNTETEAIDFFVARKVLRKFEALNLSFLHKELKITITNVEINGIFIQIEKQGF